MTLFLQKALQSFDLQYGALQEYASPRKKVHLIHRLLPSLGFYIRAIPGPTWHICRAAHSGMCDDYTWVYNSARIGRLLENVGCHISITGIKHLYALEEPCVIVANHMSTLETFLLPSILRPKGPVTFVVKESLMKKPLFGQVLESRDAIAVGRASAREDLKHVLEEGKKRLDKGMSVVIFPQSTRGKFTPSKFNSIGIKLAKHAGRKIIPLALKTDAWGQSPFTKDFGAINPQKSINFAFGEALEIHDQGKEEHTKICNFIAWNLNRWYEAEG